MIIDVHNHFAVPEYVNLLLGRAGFPSMERQGDGYLIHVSPMDTYVLPDGMFRLDTRMEEMERSNVDRHVMSIIVPAGEVAGSEDCLVLNVFAPPFEENGIPTGADRLPVLFKFDPQSGRGSYGEE